MATSLEPSVPLKSLSDTLQNLMLALMGELSLWLVIQDTYILRGDCYPGGLHLQHLSGLEGHFVQASCPLWKRRIPILSGETAISEAFTSSISRGERATSYRPRVPCGTARNRAI